MSNSINVNMDNFSAEERATFIELIEKANKPKSKVWRPECNEIYYTVDAFGDCCRGCWENDDSDEKAYKTGNCFKTEKEAEFEIEKRIVVTELQRYAIEHNKKEIDWNNETKAKHFIYYDHSCSKFCTEYWYNCQFQGAIYFTSKETAFAAIEEIGEDRIKKYLFGVEN